MDICIALRISDRKSTRLNSSRWSVSPSTYSSSIVFVENCVGESYLTCALFSLLSLFGIGVIVFSGFKPVQEIALFLVDSLGQLTTHLQKIFQIKKKRGSL